VWEAVLHGIPVVCSNIPVLREQLDRIGGRVLWFDPHDPHDLSRQLRELKQNYETYKAHAVNQVSQLRHRKWDEVANEYWSIILNSRMPFKEKSK
jgi:glycosyltransferase involved in cell wall biosynthesis